jgi:hypothetical protein
MAETEKKEIEDILAEPKEDELDIEEAVSEPEEAVKEEVPDIEPEKDNEIEKDEEPNDDKDVLEKAVSEDKEEIIEETPEKIIGKPKRSMKKWLKITLIVGVTVLVTTAAVLGAVYWYTQKNQKKTETQTPAQPEETVTEETTEEPTVTTTDTSVYVNTTDGLRLRKEPNPTAEILDTMPFGTKLTPLEKSGDWIKVTYNGKTGWCMAAYTGSENPLIYKNTDYGFQITFPEAWMTYKLIPTKAETGVTAGYYVALATTDTTYTDSSGEKGYDSLFAISIYTKAQWTTASAEEGPKPTLAVQNDKYVIAYSLPNGIPAKDMTERAKEAKSVITTLKFY